MGSLTRRMDSQGESKQFLLLLTVKNLENIYLSTLRSTYGKVLTDRYAPDKKLNKSNKNWCNSVAVHKKVTTASEDTVVIIVFRYLICLLDRGHIIVSKLTTTTFSLFYFSLYLITISGSY